jgi:hypothetical protein
MSCEQFKLWLQESLDAPQPAVPADLERHAAACADCRSWKDAAGKLQVGMRLLAAPVPSPGLTGRIVAMVLQENLARHRRRQRVWIGFAVAASLLCAISAAIVWRASTVRGPQVPVVRTGSSSRENSSQVSSTGNSSEQALPKLLSDLMALGFRPGASSKGERNRVAYAIETVLRRLGSQSEREPETVADGIEDMSSLVSWRLRRTADHGKTLFDLVTPMPPMTPDGASTAPPEISPPPFGDAGDNVQAGLKPVTGSARRAVDLFMREVPGMGPDK